MPNPTSRRAISTLLPPNRHELARTLALEDGERWRLAEAAAAMRGVESTGGVAPADVDRLRATAAGAAKLFRALAQGEVRARARVCLRVLTVWVWPMKHEYFPQFRVERSVRCEDRVEANSGLARARELVDSGSVACVHPVCRRCFGKTIGARTPLSRLCVCDEERVVVGQLLQVHRYTRYQPRPRNKGVRSLRNCSKLSHAASTL